MGSIIITMPKTEDANRLRDIIRRSGLDVELEISTMGSDTLQMVKNKDISLIICTRRFKDMGYEELVSYLPTYVNVLLLTKDVAQAAFNFNVVKLQMPFKPEDLIDSIQMLAPELAFRRRRKARPVRSAEDKKVIEDAKLLLMNRNNMTEPEAFRYIQKNSMDSGRTMKESALMILMMLQ